MAVNKEGEEEKQNLRRSEMAAAGREKVRCNEGKVSLVAQH